MKITLPRFDDELFKSIKERAKPYDVTYHLFNTDKDPHNVTMSYINKLEKKSVNDAACFSGIRGSISKCYNSLAYVLTDANIKYMSTLSMKEVRKWIRLCKNYGFIGKDVSIKFGVKHPYIVMKFDNYTKNQLYIYLCSIRYLAEWPHYVKAVLTFYDSGLPFYSAFVAASRLTIDSTVHHFISVLKLYGEYFTTHNEIFDAGFNIRYLIGLKLMLSNFKKYDTYNVYTERFNCVDCITCTAPSKFNCKVLIKELFTNELKNLANAKTLDQMEKYYKEYEKNISKYKFIIPPSQQKKKEEAVNA